MNVSLPEIVAVMSAREEVVLWLGMLSRETHTADSVVFKNMILK